MYTSYSGKSRTSSNIAWHRPQSSGARVEDELMEKSRRALCHTTDPLERLRLMCFSRGAAGIMCLGRFFRSMDEDGSNRLDKDQFKHGIKVAELELTDEEADELFDKFDTDNTGSICLDEFIKQIRPAMSETRTSILEKAFRKLDRDGHGLVSVKDIRALYSAESNPRYMSGEDSADKVLHKFLANFEQEGIDDGKVTLEEFMNYYSGISESVDNDCYFDLMIRQFYKL